MTNKQCVYIRISGTDVEEKDEEEIGEDKLYSLFLLSSLAKGEKTLLMIVIYGC